MTIPPQPWSVRVAVVLLCLGAALVVAHGMINWFVGVAFSYPDVSLRQEAGVEDQALLRSAVVQAVRVAPGVVVGVGGLLTLAGLAARGVSAARYVAVALGGVSAAGLALYVGVVLVSLLPRVAGTLSGDSAGWATGPGGVVGADALVLGVLANAGVGAVGIVVGIGVLVALGRASAVAWFAASTRVRQAAVPAPPAPVRAVVRVLRSGALLALAQALAAALVTGSYAARQSDDPSLGYAVVSLALAAGIVGLASTTPFVAIAAGWFLAAWQLARRARWARPVATAVGGVDAVAGVVLLVLTAQAVGGVARETSGPVLALAAVVGGVAAVVTVCRLGVVGVSLALLWRSPITAWLRGTVDRPDSPAAPLGTADRPGADGLSRV